MVSRFHEAALRQLSVDGTLDGAAMKALAARATKLGLTFPASFVEWYGMRDGIALLKRNSNCDEPLPIEQLGEPLGWRWPAPVDGGAERRLVFMIENQSVCIWALQLDGSDDPPVLVARDPDLEWRPCAETFSAFIDCQVWDHVQVLDAEASSPRILLEAQDAPLRSEALAFLRDNFNERTTTHGWPGDTQYRFERGETRILLWDGEDQTDWFIRAPEQELTMLIENLWSRRLLDGPLYGKDARGEEVLRALRARFSPT